MAYSQNNEEQIILEYFKNSKIGHVLSIGENDGKTFSNSLALIERGWSADLVEPSPYAFELLKKQHENNDKVFCHNLAIGLYTEEVTLHINDPHIPNDVSLLATTKPEEKNRWGALKFNEVKVSQYTYSDFAGEVKYDFITIDAEGADWDILQQINLANVGCKLLCIEHNGKDIDKYRNYCEKYGMRQIAINAENIIMGL
jgi:FkbM family methyltransferase